MYGSASNVRPYPTSELDLFSLSERRTGISTSTSTSLPNPIKNGREEFKNSMKTQKNHSNKREKIKEKNNDKLIPKLVQLKGRFRRPNSIHKALLKSSDPSSDIYTANGELQEPLNKNIATKEKKFYKNEIYEESIPFRPAHPKVVQRIPIRGNKKMQQKASPRRARNSVFLSMNKNKRIIHDNYFDKQHNPSIPFIGTMLRYIDNIISTEFPCFQPYRKHIKIILILLILYQFNLIMETLQKYISDMATP